MFNFKVSKQDTTATVYFEGILSVKDTAKVKAELIGLRDSGITHLIFNFSKLTYLDSSGIGLLLHAYNWTKEKLGSIRIQHMSNEIRTIFQISNLTDVFIVE